VRSRRLLAIVALVASLAALPGSAGAAARKHRLHAFASCSSFVHYARRHAPKEMTTRGVPIPEPLVAQPPQPMTENGQVAPQSAAPQDSAGAGQDFSGTNNQEAGVDEPDTVKTDGNTIYTVENGVLYALDARSDPPKLLDSLKLDGDGQQLLLAGNRLLVTAGSPIVYAVEPLVSPGVRAAAVALPGPFTQQSTLTLVDVSQPTALKVLNTMSVNGGYLDARMTGHTARVIFSATPRILPVLQRATPAGAPTSIRRSTTPDWRPTYKLRRGRTGKIARHALVRCTSIAQPDVFSGLNSLTVLTIDIDKGLTPVDSDAIMTDGETVYASPKNLYIATQKALLEKPDATQPPPLADQQTEIHKFDISDPDQTTYEGSGVVTGTLLNQYSMSEQDGDLRVASTNAPLWWSPGSTGVPSESFVTVLRQNGTSLDQIGRVGDLGKGERIYAVRFLGDVGYVVTFRQIDPLYTVGLADPTNPKVLGSVDLQGYSSYLHPVGDGLLLGVGQAAGPQDTEPEGVQVSLFDVSDPARPTRISNALVGNGSSTQAQFDPHAFLWWDPLKLAVLPVEIYDNNSSNQFVGAIGFHATKADGVKEAGRVNHPADSYGYAARIDRSLVVGNRLFTVSADGVLASDLGTFASDGFVPFPLPSGNVGSGVSSPPAKTGG
jgi:hypothetical protein